MSLLTCLLRGESFTVDEHHALMASYAANIAAGMTERNAAILAVEAETLQVLADHKEILEAIAAVVPEGMFTKSEAMQLGLFDMPVHVETYVKKDGTVVNAHVASRKKKPVVPKRAPVGLTPDLFTDTATHHHQEVPHATTQPVPETVTAVHQAPEPEAEIAAPEDLPDTLEPFGVDAGITKPARRKLNARAIEIVNSKDSGFTDEEKTALAKYSGTGGVGDSLNEFYTRPDVAAAMWSLLAQLGVSSGTVLEPSSGTGVFLHTAPGAVTVVGVELDDASAKIARALHGDRHEVHQASMEGFANLDVRQFDAVIGNVPFGVRGSLVADDKPDLPTAEQYFLDTAIDKTKSDGIVALIVPTGIMDNANTRTYRESLLKKAQFVAAYRLPNTAFSHSHTSVTSDIVVFRKRAQDVAGALSVLPSEVLKAVGGFDDAFVSGQYFTGNTDHVFGTPEAGWRAKAGMGNDFTVVGTMDGVAQAIAASGINSIPAQTITMQDVLTALGTDDALRQRAVNGALSQPYDVASLGDTKTERGVTYVLQGHPPRWHRVGGDDAIPASVTDGVALGNMLERMFADEGNVNRKGVIEGLDEYVQKHGIPSKNKALMRAAQDDKALWRLIGAVNADGTYSNLVTGTSREDGADLDAVARRLILDHGTFTVEELAQAWHGGDAEAALDHLIASKQYAVAGDAKTWTDFDTYLTGELWPKLDGARAALQRADLDAAYRTKYEHQAAALDEAIGPKTLEDVELQMNSGWVPLAIIERWQNELKAAGNEWMRQQPDLKIAFNEGVYHLFGGTGDRILLDKYLNRSGVRQDDMPRVDEMNRDFKAWVLTSDVREQMEDLYNRKFLGFRKKQFSDAPIQIPGLTTDRAINSYHFSNLRWALQQGKGIIADDVGLGKTLQCLCLTKLAKTYGQAKKPMIVVPKSVLANWVSEIEVWFPGSKVLTIGETVTRDKNGKLSAKADNETVRNTKYHELSQNADYDFVLITQPAWNDLDLNPIKKGEYVNQDFWVQRADAMGKAGDKQRNKIREQYKQAVAGRDFRKRSDAIWFDELGVDMVLYDEFHAYKNLWAARNRFGEQPKFLGGSGLSNRAHDTYLKNKYIRENNGGKGVFGLTATPTKNSPLEVYSMLSHVAPEAFDAIGVGNSEAFLDRFCVFENDNIVNTQGQVENALVTAGFKNLDELRGIMARYINRRTALDVGLKIPDKKTVEHLIDMSSDQEALYVALREQARTAGKDENSAHIFSVMSNMGKAAIDLELVGPEYAGAHSPKLEAAADAIVTGAKDGGQVVFSDFIATHQKLRALLIARGLGADEVSIINAQETESSLDRQAVSNALNSGKVKVVIGNTATMGEGVNLQKLTTDIHNLDQPWEPASMQQRLGRGVRQGNKHDQVRVHAYLSKGSFDGYRYQTIAAKRDWQDALWHGADTIENLSRVGKIDREEMLIMLAANPDEARVAYAANKGAALEREAAKQRGEAAGVFVKFQEMKRSFAGLKNKGSETAARVKMKLDKYRLGLQANKYFTAKEALDVEVPVVVQPQTGTAWHVGRAFEMDPGPDAPINWSADAKSTWVVTGVGMGAGHERNELMVTARPYGSTATQVYSIPLSKMHRGIVPVEYDAGAETHAVEARAAQLHEAGATTAKNPAELKNMPSEMLTRLTPLIQQQLRDAFRGYKDSWRGPVGMLDATGKPVAYASYDARKHLDTHTFILPTSEHRAALLQAWVDMELNRTIKTHYQEGRKRRGSYLSSTVNGVEAAYSGFEYGDKGNPFKSIGVQLFGPEIEVEARTALRQVVMDRMDKAATFASAMNDATPLVEISTYGGTAVKWPKEVLTALWARAQKEGITHSNLREVLQAGVASGKTSILHSGLINSNGGVLNALTMAPEGSIARWLNRQASAAGDAALMQDILGVIDGHEPD